PSSAGGSKMAIAAPRTTGRAGQSRPSLLLRASGPAPSEGFVGFLGEGGQFFSGVELQDQFTDLRAELADFAVVDCLLVLRSGLQATLAGLEERLHPALDLGLREVVLAAHVHELRFTLDQLQEQLDLPPRCPSLKVFLHRLSLWTGALCPVQSERGTTSHRA